MARKASSAKASGVATVKRKGEHVRIALSGNVDYARPSGFDDVELLHKSLPEIDFASIDTKEKLFGKKLAAPFLIEAMTGGYPEAKAINLKLAAAAQKAGIAFGLGSMRAALETPTTEMLSTYAVREAAPDIPIIGNIGLPQLKTLDLDALVDLLDKLDCDALAIHLNALQEAIQPEGDRDFSGGLNAIQRAVSRLDIPVVVKETGAGIDAPSAARLREVGVQYVDVAGAGGTSWSKVEYARQGKTFGPGSASGKGSAGVPGFEEWGTPTVEAIISCSAVTPVFASGGVRSGVDAAKALALGAMVAGAAKPFLQAKDPALLAEEWKNQLRTAMFLTGSANLAELRQAPIAVTGATAERLRLYGVKPEALAQR